jgi:hypothetical protein
MDIRYTISRYLEEHKNNGANAFINFIRRTFREGKIDRNQIRKGVLQQAQDKTAVYFGSLLLQLDNKEIRELLNEKL